ncbi:DUF3168 domain-containing protein [Pseudovibrio exalbescens]|uniref:DUF3168 domain-containing protein n=1 Tax=Pseudovibrio exalbescens TaxID=197461 RepID=UPI000C9C9BF2|nr:DUF3168 domain-containing protein [Pseudovibrio exalbescens]
MMDYAVPLQRWLYEALTQPAIQGICAVVDHRPQYAHYPFIEIAGFEFVEDDAQCAPGGSHVLTLHIWSRGRGQSEVKQIMVEIYERLHDKCPAIAGLSTCFTRVDQTRVLNDPDGMTRHGVMTIQFTCRKEI